MRHIPTLALDDGQYFDDIAAAKRQPRQRCLQGLRAAVMMAYEGYVNAAPDVAALPHIPLRPCQCEALIHAYSVDTAPMIDLHGRLLNRVIAARCPFCGISEASTLDHYLPKEIYPQFSIFSRNLIPCCGQCNTRKSQLILDEKTDVRLFLHPYFDTIPAESFLTVSASLLPDALALSFRLTRPPKMVLPVFQHLRSHFTQLRLAERYRLMSLDHLRDRYRAFARFYGPGEDAQRVANELLQDADDIAEFHGPNHWRAVLYRTLAAEEDFCDGGFKVLQQVQ